MSRRIEVQPGVFKTIPNAPKMQSKTHPAKCAVCGTEHTVVGLREHFEAGWRYTDDSPQRSLCPEHVS